MIVQKPGGIKLGRVEVVWNPATRSSLTFPFMFVMTVWRGAVVIDVCRA